MLSLSLRPDPRYLICAAGLLLATACGSDGKVTGATSSQSATTSASGGSAGQGGTSQGGTSQGGTSQGGMSQGGMGGTTQGGMGGTTQGGMGGTSQGGAGGGQMAMAKAECANDKDCQLVDNCCDCMGLPSGSPVPICNQKCKATTCTMQALPLPKVAHCEVGRCVAGFNCKWADVSCKAVQPVCPAGETNSVIGTCWGPCVPATQCEFISYCKQCSPTQVCVTKQAKIDGGLHCVDLPSECSGSATCGCMGASVCQAPFDTCASKAGQLMCSCPNC